MNNVLDNPYSGLINLMREQGSKYNPPGLILGEVKSPPPQINIKVGDIQLDKDNLYIADYLLPNYKRDYILEGTLTLNDTSTYTTTGTTTETTNDTLKIGDLVVLQKVENTNKFILFCKVVTI